MQRQEILAGKYLSSHYLPLYLCTMDANELVFEVTQENDGGYTAECLNENIFTQADTWEDLRKNVREAVSAFYFDRQMPSTVRLHLVRDETLSAA
jgi:Zn-finger protein